MHALAFPPPSSLFPTSFGRRPEPVNSIENPLARSCSAKAEEQTYPSPPMSDSHSPHHRSARPIEPGLSYPAPPMPDARRPDVYPFPPHQPHQPSHYDPRHAPSPHGLQYQRPLYAAEDPKARPTHYHPQARPYEHPYPGSMHPPAGPWYHIGTPGNPGPVSNPLPRTIIAPPRPAPKPARRTKAHVASACINCKKAHLSCDVQRPCGRCVASGKQETCKDVQHKKRGRPRLRDDKEFGRGEDRHGMTLPGVQPAPAPGTLPVFASHRPAGLLPVLNAPDPLAEALAKTNGSEHAQPPDALLSYGRIASNPWTSRPPVPAAGYYAVPVAFLNLDLHFLRCNEPFEGLLSAASGQLGGKSLTDYLEPESTDVMNRMRAELRNERDEREPAYMAPITPVGEDPVMSIRFSEIDMLSHGLADRIFALKFRLPHGRQQTFQCQVRLAKKQSYFVTLVVHSGPRPAGPPLLTQQLVPPTPLRASHSLSAPTTAPARDFSAYPHRHVSSAGSAPSSPYFNFSQVRTSLPTLSAGAYNTAPQTFSPTSRSDLPYYQSAQTAPPNGPYPSLPPVTRTVSGSSEPQIRRENAPDQSLFERVQLPPIRTAAESEPPRGPDFGDRSRPQTSPASADRPDTPSAGKRRRLNIHEVLQ